MSNILSLMVLTNYNTEITVVRVRGIRLTSNDVVFHTLIILRFLLPEKMVALKGNQTPAEGLLRGSVFSPVPQISR
jgi:hypothetical protein